MVTNFFKLCLCQKVFISPSLLKDKFARYINLGWFTFLLTSLNVSFWPLLACMVSKALSHVILTFVSLLVSCLFSLWLLSGFSLYLWFPVVWKWCLDVCVCFACLFCFSFCLWVIFLGVFWVSVTLSLSLIWWYSSHLLFQILYSFLFLLYLVFPLHGHCMFCGCPTVLDKLSNLGILFPALTGVIVNTKKPVFIFVSVFHLQNLV